MIISPELYKKLFQAVRKRFKTDSVLKKFLDNLSKATGKDGKFTYEEVVKGKGDEGEVILKFESKEFDEKYDAALKVAVKFYVNDRPTVFCAKNEYLRLYNIVIPQENSIRIRIHQDSSI